MNADNTSPELTTLLERAFAFPMSSRARQVADEHVRRAIATEAAHGRNSRAGFFRARSRAVLVGGIATLLLAGSVAASGGLFDSLIAGSPMLENAWESAADLNLSVTDSNYTVVLEKAAVDSERVWVAIAVNDAAGVGQMQVVDANGLVLTDGTGAGTGDLGGETATIFGFRIPDGVALEGPLTLQVTSLTGPDGSVPGDWVFTFDLPATAGAQ